MLEVRLIHEHLPPFNRQAKLWRRYAYLKLTLDERWPRLSIVRVPKRGDGCLYLGPLASRSAARLVADAIETAAPLRRCTQRPGRDQRAWPVRARAARGGCVPVRGNELRRRLRRGGRPRRAGPHRRARPAARTARRTHGGARVRRALRGGGRRTRLRGRPGPRPPPTAPARRAAPGGTHRAAGARRPRRGPRRRPPARAGHAPRPAPPASSGRRARVRGHVARRGGRAVAPRALRRRTITAFAAPGAPARAAKPSARGWFEGADGVGHGERGLAAGSRGRSRFLGPGRAARAGARDRRSGRGGPAASRARRSSVGPGWLPSLFVDTDPGSSSTRHRPNAWRCPLPLAFRVERLAVVEEIVGVRRSRSLPKTWADLHWRCRLASHRWWIRSTRGSRTRHGNHPKHARLGFSSPAA